jgi:broad specificity phosphatase PhoE
LRPDEGLREIGQGEWEGRLATEIAERWGEVLDAWRARPTEAWAPGGESLDEVQARVRPTLADAFGRLAAAAGPGAGTGSRVLGYHSPPPTHPWSIVVAHDGVFKVLVLTLLDLPLERFWLLPFNLCGISVIELVAGEPRLRAHNLTDHLAPLLDERAQEVTEERERAGAL